MSARDPVRELVDRLVEGDPIDWQDGVGGDAAMLDALHMLDEVRGAYRRIGSDAPATPVLFRWGPLSALEKIGDGASAEVWRAWDPGLATHVALKLLRPEAAAAGLRSDEFLREGRLLAKLAHRNVLRVYGAAVHDGRPGIWNEWIEGRTLEAIVAADGPLASAEAAHVGLELCAALGAIHASGLVHGDVKASNVLRARGGRIVLVDLGACGTPDALGASLRTQATPAYLSPQAHDGAPRTAADDLYALGVLLHFLLTGTYPQEGRSRVRALVPDADPRVVDAVERALLREPSQRPADVHAFATALRAMPVDTRTNALGTRRVWIAAVALAVLAMVGAAAWQAFHAAAWEPKAALVRHGRADVPLHDGETLGVGDRLDLALSSDRPTWVYVLNEDDAGSFHVLFPLAGLPGANPLPRGDNILPGERDGRALSWQVSSAGGREEFVVVLADAALPRLEQRIAALAAATVDPIDRGVGRVSSSGPLASVGVRGHHLIALLDELSGELGDSRHARLSSYRFEAPATP